MSCFEWQLLNHQAVRSQIAEAQKIANGGGSQQDVAEAQIELEV
jgi:F-type H+-transporting ATPase subunit delta